MCWDRSRKLLANYRVVPTGITAPRDRHSAGKVICDAIGRLVKDPQFRERTGLQASKVAGEAIATGLPKRTHFRDCKQRSKKRSPEMKRRWPKSAGKVTTRSCRPSEKQGCHEAMTSPEFFTKPIPGMSEEKTVLDAIAKAAKASVPVAIGFG